VRPYSVVKKWRLWSRRLPQVGECVFAEQPRLQRSTLQNEGACLCNKLVSLLLWNFVKRAN